MGIRVTVNGEPRELEGLDDGVALADVLAALQFKSDRIAVERNGEIAPRRSWESVQVSSGDRLEVVHFVGGGSGGRRIGEPAEAAELHCT